MCANLHRPTNNSHDREICTRSLRAAQDSRSSPGAFPPPAPEPLPSLYDINNERNNDDKIAQNPYRNHQRPHRPNSLHIGKSRQCISPNNSRVQFSPVTPFPSSSTASAAVTNYSSRGLFEDLPNTTVASSINVVDNSVNSGGGDKPTRGFELNVNVACSPAGQVPRLDRSNPIGEQLSHYKELRLTANHECETVDHTRGYTSVSLILRPPSSEPQPPIDIRSQGSSLTYSTSSSDARGFQSRLLISIGPGKVGSVAAARIKSRMGHTRPNSLVSAMQSTSNQSTGSVVGPSSQLPRPTMSSSTTGSLAVAATTPNTIQNCPNLSSTMASSATTSCMTTNHIATQLNQVTEHQKKLVTEQLKRKERLAHELRIEKMRLETMKKDLQILLRPVDPTVPPQGLKKKLRSEIYQLQVECDRLADEVDQRSDPRVPFGETNEEFYQGIYTGQCLNIPSFALRPRPPLPAIPPAWEPQSPRIHPSNHDRDDRDGPSWVCRMCTFDNHPLMDKCEQCDMPKFRVPDTGETQDIHIRVTRHHNFSPRRTVHSWVV
ncbi:TGF-beta-activated kinase 1 and MAP3K7-binding protein 3 isoform X2 [Diachasma alloeum]|uniref:TGF-beta-activated kinase 1 and MAP3K7-binding protein 3 isoform X2 n=1 Tax=Diachasma alloeum TaxID=454923 RepID=UPI0007381356|nr:TGF-beta-activated kinase 1 and MAP3K7-binding protein 3 isoform X2 [Diachasma alloeum]